VPRPARNDHCHMNKCIYYSRSLVHRFENFLTIWNVLPLTTGQTKLYFKYNISFQDFEPKLLK